jgi:hypothetical protein
MVLISSEDASLLPHHQRGKDQCCCGQWKRSVCQGQISNKLQRLDAVDGRDDNQPLMDVALMRF